MGTEWARVYPSPVVRGEDLRVVATGVQDELTVDVYDVQGRLVLRWQDYDLIGTQYVDLPTRSLVPACYLVRVQTKKKTFSQKIIVWRE